MKIISLIISTFLAVTLSGSISWSQRKPVKKLPPKEASREAIQKATEVPVISPETAPPESDHTVPIAGSRTYTNDRFANFTMNPLAVVVGSVDAGIDFKTGQHWLVGPRLLMLNLKILDVEFATHGMGLGVTWTPMTPSLSDGFYLQTTLGGGSVLAASSTNTGRYKTTSNIIYYSLSGGYHWFWNNFNLKAGVSSVGANLRDIQVRDNNNMIVDSGRVPLPIAVTIDLGFVL